MVSKDTSGTDDRLFADRQEKIVIQNSYGEKLVGVLHEAGSKEIVVICHGFRSSKECIPMINLAASLQKTGISGFRFDFAGNGESEGSFQYGNYRREVEDLRAVVQHFLEKRREITAIVGHSKGGNVVLLYASKYNDVRRVVNICGRFALDTGIEDRLGKDFLQRIRRDGFIDVYNRRGRFEYRVTEESLMDRLTTDVQTYCRSIHKACRRCRSRVYNGSRRVSISCAGICKCRIDQDQQYDESMHFKTLTLQLCNSYMRPFQQTR